jgi:hypothetical protein
MVAANSRVSVRPSNASLISAIVARYGDGFEQVTPPRPGRMRRIASSVGGLNALLMYRCAVVICLMHLLDVLTTTVGVSRGFVELNPIAAFSLSHGGIGGFVLAKGGTAGMTLMMLAKQSRTVMVALTLATLGAVGTAVLCNTAQLLHV